MTERLERRVFLSASAVNVTVHHGDPANDGANLNETALTPTDVTAADFGKRFTTAVDGVVTAQPLYVQNVAVTRGSSPGVHAVLYVATEHDSLYAIDANTGAVLWRDSFLNTADPTSTAATTGVTTQPASEVGDNAGPELGCWATPAIDTGRGEIFLNAATQERRGTDLHFVQRLWAVQLSDGTPVVAPAVIGDTISNGPRLSYTGYRYVAGPIVAGSGNNKTPTAYPNTDGWAAAPGGATTPVIAFNALIQGERTSVTLLNGNVYLGFAAHSDDCPYYGWVLGYAESTLALTAAFVTTPTYDGIVGDDDTYTAQGGIWASGGAIATDSTNLFVATGNGAFNPAPSNFDAAGFPRDHDYADTLLKLQIDPASSPSKQNGNGWGLSVADYFTPSNANALNERDLDLSSGSALLLPDTITDRAGHPLLVVGGKESRVYVLDRDDLGKFNDTYPLDSDPDPRPYDRVVNEYAGDGIDGTGRGVYSAPAYANGTVYVTQSNAPAVAFAAGALAAGQTPTPLSATAATFGYPGPTFTVSANGTAGGVVWGVDAATSDLLAYDAANLNTPLYTSNTVSGDAFAGAVKFGVPTVVNGMAYVGGTADTVVGYGLRTAYLTNGTGTFAAATNLTAAAVTAGNVHLAWAAHATLASLFRIDRSADGTTWTTLAYVTAATTGYDDATATPGTHYSYRVAAVSGANATAAITTTVTTPLTGTVIGTPGSYQNGGNTVAKAFDGNLTTYVDLATANGGWAGLDLGGVYTLSAVAYAARGGYASRMNGGAFQASNTPDFSAGVVTLFTVPANANPSAATLTTHAVTAAGAFRYVRYLSPNGGYGNVAELQFFGTPVAARQLTGTAFGTAGSYQNSGNTVVKAFDGNLSTYVDAAAGNGVVIGVDLGAAAMLTQFRFAPRSGYASRMVGGVFQASNTADFSSGVVTLYTVAAAPPSGSLTTVAVTPPTAYRYIRYLAPANSYGNLAEFQLVGTD